MIARNRTHQQSALLGAVPVLVPIRAPGDGREPRVAGCPSGTALLPDGRCVPLEELPRNDAPQDAPTQRHVVIDQWAANTNLNNPSGDPIPIPPGQSIWEAVENLPPLVHPIGLLREAVANTLAQAGIEHTVVTPPGDTADTYSYSDGEYFLGQNANYPVARIDQPVEATVVSSYVEGLIVEGRDYAEAQGAPAVAAVWQDALDSLTTVAGDDFPDRSEGLTIVYIDAPEADDDGERNGGDGRDGGGRDGGGRDGSDQNGSGRDGSDRTGGSRDGGREARGDGPARGDGSNNEPDDGDEPHRGNRPRRRRKVPGAADQGTAQAAGISTWTALALGGVAVSALALSLNNRR